MNLYAVCSNSVCLLFTSFNSLLVEDKLVSNETILVLWLFTISLVLLYSSLSFGVVPSSFTIVVLVIIEAISSYSTDILVEFVLIFSVLLLTIVFILLNTTSGV